MKGFLFFVLLIIGSASYGAITPEYLFRVESKESLDTSTWIIVIGNDPKNTLIQSYTVYIGERGKMNAHKVDYVQHEADDSQFFYFSDGGELEVPPDWNWHKNMPTLSWGSFSSVKLSPKYNDEIQTLSPKQLSQFTGHIVRGPIRRVQTDITQLIDGCSKKMAGQELRR